MHASIRRGGGKHVGGRVVSSDVKGEVGSVNAPSGRMFVLDEWGS